MKIALLTTSTRVAPVFENTSIWLNIEATAKECFICSSEHFKTEHELDMANELLENNVEMVICGAIPYYLEKVLIHQGCEVFAFISGEVDQVIKALHVNSLDKPEFRMPGCQMRKKQQRKYFCQDS